MSTTTYDMLVTKMTDGLGVDAAAIRPDATFADLEIDSLAALELGVILEEDQGISLDLEYLKETDMNLSQFSAYLDTLLEEKHALPAEAG
ncbi:MAG: acyl carrier protein [Streptomyces sp.]